VLSVVGTNRLPESGYFRAKVAQEDTVKAGPVPYSILRASQFFEFIGRIADSSTDGDKTARLSPVFVQPESAAGVAAALADVAPNEPVNGIIELGSPEQFRPDELARRHERPAPCNGRRPRPVLRHGVRRPPSHPGQQRTHRADPLRRLAQRVRDRVNDPSRTKEIS
jgi:hypothetical protein